MKESHDEAKRKRDNYVNDNINYATDEFKEEIKDKKLSLIKERMYRNRIKDNVRHSNLYEQCNYYNYELKKHGIELRYIVP